MFFDFKPNPLPGKYKQADLSADATSFVANPLLINGAVSSSSNNITDLSIPTNSPAKNAGAIITIPGNTSPSFSKDINGKARGSVWDIGAYEF